MLFPTHYILKPPVGAQPILGHPLTPTAAWIMNEGSGLMAFDIIGRNHGTFGAGAAAPSWVPEGLNFDGGDYINCGNHSSVKLSGARTVAARVKGTYGAADLHSIVAKYGTCGGGDDDYYLVVYQKKIRGYIAHSTTLNKFSNSVQTLLDDKWYDIGMSWDGSSSGGVRIYINGIDDTAIVNNDAFTTAYTTTENLIIGARKEGTERYFDGIIDEVRIYNRALNASEIWQLYTNPYCWLAHPLQAELMYAPPAIGAIMNQFQRANLGADLMDGVLIT